jgi:hypothetical protein
MSRSHDAASGLDDTSLAGPLDETLVESTGPQSGPRSWRRLLQWSATSVPVGLLLLSGIAMGPQGLSVLSSETLALLAPAIPVALVTLGVLLGLSVRIGAEPRDIAGAATVEAALTIAVVWGGFAALAAEYPPALGTSTAVLAAAAGIAAASSLTLPTSDPLEPRSAATRLLEVDGLLAVLAGAAVLAWVHAGSVGGAVLALAAAFGVVVGVAIAARLLLTAAASETEERVITMAVLLLVGGVAHALSMSALSLGVVAGVCWRSVARRAVEAIRRDVLFVQHPLLVLVLIVAGASASVAPLPLALGAAYAVLRTVSRLAAGAAITRARGDRLHPTLGRYLLPPGVFGVAFALNAASMWGTSAAVLLDTVVAGTIAAELIAFVLPAREARG